MPSRQTSLELQLQRDVARLDFNDFATRVGLANDAQVDAGNTTLAPERKLTASATLRRDFRGRGSVVGRLAYAQVQDTQDLIPIQVRNPDGDVIAVFDGPVNIGSSRRWDIELSSTIPVDAIPGLEITLLGHVHTSRVTDPVPGRSRDGSGANNHGNSGVARSMPERKLNWGLQGYWNGPQANDFHNQHAVFERGFRMVAHVEYTGFAMGTLRLDLTNPTDTCGEQNRTFYTGSRASDAVDRQFDRRMRFGRTFMLTFKGSF